jgi:hypothetical protein
MDGRLVLNELFRAREVGIRLLTAWMRLGPGRILAAPSAQRAARTRREALVAAELAGHARDARALPGLSGFVGGAEAPPVMLVAIFFCDIMSACIAPLVTMIGADATYCAQRPCRTPGRQRGPAELGDLLVLGRVQAWRAEKYSRRWVTESK